MKKIEKIRLNKLVAERSEYSRREADDLIQKGFVKVYDEVVTNPAEGFEKHADISVKNKRLKPATDFFTAIVYNKPKGELVSKSDPRGRKTIFDSLDNEFKKFVPVGRLDYASEGVLILTDSTKIATALMESKLERTYNIKIKGDITKQLEDAMLEGIELKHSKVGAHDRSAPVDMVIQPFIAYKITKNSPTFSKLSVKIAEGQNRELRRFFAHFKREVADLKRVAYGFISLNALPTGKTRYLSKSEYKELRDFIKQGE
jgi:23S rRNA pseudouridine2605 synthase